jgi:transcriptional regulator with XRE-family HTH domain
MQRFGEKLHILRKRRGMTMKELASELGFSSHGFISALESGRRKPSAELAVKLSRLFDVTTDQLLKDELELD